jgi:hypothetical protein
MNLEQATQLAESLNETLAERLADAYVIYMVLPQWSIDYTKIYNVVLIPSSLNYIYGTATDSQKLSFARVSLASQLGQPASYEDFVNTFTEAASKDPELNQYINTKP